MMEYKGYIGEYDYDEEAKIYHGHVGGIKGVITFEADQETGLFQAFQDSIEDYLELD